MSILPCCMGDNMVTVYDGWRCLVCETVYPCGCEPWGETAGSPVRSADLRMLRRYLALAEEALAEQPEVRYHPEPTAEDPTP